MTLKIRIWICTGTTMWRD